MKSLYAYLIGIVLISTSVCARAQNGDLNLNGMAAFEQLRKEYYIGALYLGWPGHDPATIANMPGKKRMQINVTADRWPSLRFSQMWNQAITINNPSATINANALDILAFTSLPKGDLVEGDRLIIELAGNNTTQVSVNGALALRTNSPALFNMLLNAWIGPRPPTSEFKRDILDLPKDQAATDLVARFENVHPNDARKKTIAGWGFKVEPEAAAAAVTATAAAPAAATSAAPKKPETAETSKPEVAAKAAPETKPAAAEAKPAEQLKPAAPKPAAPPTEIAKATPAAPAAQPAQTDSAAAAAKAARDKAQDALNNEYYGVVRKQVLKNIEYPRRAVKENIEGLVMVRVKVDRGGGLNSFEVAQSADDLLDAEAERAVKKAAPFPKAPDALDGNNFEYIVPIVFKLTQ
jgi:TonB family protein